MYEITVKRPSEEELRQLHIESWDEWSCEPSTFEWQYEKTETAYVRDGKATVKYGDLDTIIQGGDLVTFPKGMKCVWTVHEPIKKVYKFED